MRHSEVEVLQLPVALGRPCGVMLALILNSITQAGPAPDHALPATLLKEIIKQSLAPRTVKEAFRLCKALLRSYHEKPLLNHHGIVLGV